MYKISVPIIRQISTPHRNSDFALSNPTNGRVVNLELRLAENSLIKKLSISNRNTSIGACWLWAHRAGHVWQCGMHGTHWGTHVAAATKIVGISVDSAAPELLNGMRHPPDWLSALEKLNENNHGHSHNRWASKPSIAGCFWLRSL